MTIVAADSAGAIRYDDVRDGPIHLTPEEMELFANKAAAMSKLLEDKKVVATYKLELVFGARRSTADLTPGALTFWASGARFHGGGDDKLYLCPGKRSKRNDCEALLKDEYNSGSGIVCPTCGNIWKNEDVVGELLFKLPMRKWAEVLYTYFRLCNYDCDLYLKHVRNDIREVSLAQVAKQTWQGTQRLDRARSTRVRIIYPLRNIIKDTSGGADLLARFYAFLMA